MEHRDEAHQITKQKLDCFLVERLLELPNACERTE